MSLRQWHEGCQMKISVPGSNGLPVPNVCASHDVGNRMHTHAMGDPLLPGTAHAVNYS